MAKSWNPHRKRVKRVYAGISIVAVIAMWMVIGAIEGRASEHGHAAPAQHATSVVPSAEHATPAVAATSHGWWDFIKASAPGAVYRTISEKLRQAANLDQDNESLRQRLALLEVENSRLVEAHLECREQVRSDTIKSVALAEGGVESARTIASLKTADQDLLSKPPKVIFDQAAKAFERGDFETAGKAFVFLVDNSENDAFQDAQTYYFAGVSLYKLGNYKRALSYLTKSEKHATAEELSYGPRALGWMALCQKKLGNRHEENKTIRELIQKYPKSQEARRLNRNA